jgi:hypothetical protein
MFDNPHAGLRIARRQATRRRLGSAGAGRFDRANHPLGSLAVEKTCREPNGCQAGLINLVLLMHGGYYPRLQSRTDNSGGLLMSAQNDSSLDSIDAATWGPFILSFPAVGGLVGWLTGASNTPVVSAVLPLLFGLVGAVTYAYFDRQSRTADLSKKLDEIGLEPETARRVKAALGTVQGPKHLPALWGAGIALFCLVCFVGVRYGEAHRRGGYQSFAQVLASAQIADKDASPFDRAVLQNAYWRMVAQKVPTEEVQSVFTLILGPELKRRMRGPELPADIDTTVEKLFASIDSGGSPSPVPMPRETIYSPPGK